LLGAPCFLRFFKSYQAGCLTYYKGKAALAVVLDTISAELTEKRATKQASCSLKVFHSTLSILLGVPCFFAIKSYQAGCLTYYKGKVTLAVVLYTISAELTEKRATKQASCLWTFFIVP